MLDFKPKLVTDLKCDVCAHFCLPGECGRKGLGGPAVQSKHLLLKREGASDEHH